MRACVCVCVSWVLKIVCLLHGLLPYLYTYSSTALMYMAYFFVLNRSKPTLSRREKKDLLARKEHIIKNVRPVKVIITYSLMDGQPKYILSISDLLINKKKLILSLMLLCIHIKLSFDLQSSKVTTFSQP